ncbi:MAG: hypothetical protein EPN97_04115 [Alphaproteobacteria bacterium]|nr:MAG: hypothetical protein EPN97_04115 [Alphaproteobacteria bacterium]
MQDSQKIADLLAGIKPLSPQEVQSFGADAVQKINDWTRQLTGGRITELFNDLGAPPAPKTPEAPEIDYDAIARESLILQTSMNVKRPLKLKQKTGFLSY